MGLATHIPGGLVRFGVMAAAASAVLFGAVVLLGVTEASPSDVDGGGDRDPSVVLIRPHDSVAPGPRQKLPQASPGPARHQRTPTARPRPTVGVGSPAATPRPAAAPAQPAEPSNPRPAGSERKPQPSAPKTSTEQLPILEVTPPQPVPGVTLPSVTAPSVTVPRPQAPPLPTAPPLPSVSDLPG